MLHELEDETDSGEAQCLVTVGQLPANIAYGVGEDMEKAKNMAARCVFISKQNFWGGGESSLRFSF